MKLLPKLIPKMDDSRTTQQQSAAAASVIQFKGYTSLYSRQN